MPKTRREIAREVNEILRDAAVSPRGVQRPEPS